MKPVKFHPAAEQDVYDSVTHYNRKHFGLGLRFQESVEQAIDHIQRFPQTGFPSHAETRILTIRPFPYGVVFKDYNHEFRIFAVAHHHRREDYWHNRLESERENQ